MRRYRAAAILMLAHGGLMELAVAVAVVPLALAGVDQATVGAHFSFIVPYLQDNLYLMMVMSGVFGAIRIVGAIGVLRDRMWGLALSVINCVVTMGLMVFMLPAGILDGILACTALLLMLTAYFGTAPISRAAPMSRPTPASRTMPASHTTPVDQHAAATATAPERTAV